ncbi:MAG: leucine-rich repeat protein [Oscillospiraceae bacterium]|nr:leucine-rich repeat protein [Oscillospiraceae bacterium]
MKTKRKNIFKSLLALTLALIMVLGVAPISELAGVDWASLFAPKAEAATYDIYTYAVSSDGTIIITDCKESASGAITIPSEIDGKPVTSIGSWAFENCTGLTSITIPNSVTSIGTYAFYGCSGLTSITIPNSVTSIGDWAFHGCSGLTSITIPNSVTSIGDLAFHGCSGLTSITLGNSVTSIGGWAFNGCTGLTSINVASGNNYYSSNNGVLFNKKKTALIRYPQGKSQTSYTIPNSVTSIGNYAFCGCSGLTSITIPNSVTSIGDNAFYGCTGLTSITLGNSVTSIGSWAFENCTGLTSITIPNSVTSIGRGAFYECTGLTSITLGNSVTSIGSYAFYGCTGLTSITIPNSVTSIGDHAFDGCTGLRSITISNSVTSIEDDVFARCTSLTSITIPNSVTRIEDYAFAHCTGLTSITIPNSVTSIGNWAFLGCTGLTSITIPNSVTSIGNVAFSGCTGLTSINVASDNNYYSDNNGVLFNKKKTELIRYPQGKSQTSYTIPNSVTSIGRYAFYGCTGLTSITIPNSVTRIGDRAFIGCTGLKDVYYTGSKDEWKAISVGVDNYCLFNATIHYNWIDDSVLSLNRSEMTVSNNVCPYLYASIRNNSGYEKSDLVWTSSNPNVAVVDRTSGVVNPAGVGDTVITVSTSDKKYSASCKLTIQSAFCMTSPDSSVTSMKSGDTSKFIIYLYDCNGDQLPIGSSTCKISGTAAYDVVSRKNNEKSIELEIKAKSSGQIDISLSSEDPDTYNEFRINVYPESVDYLADSVPVSNKKMGTNFNRSDLTVENFRYVYDESIDKYKVTMNIYNSSGTAAALVAHKANGDIYDSQIITKHTNFPTDWGGFFGILGKGFCQGMTGDLYTYRSSLNSTLTEASIEVPADGYITISNDIYSCNMTMAYNVVGICTDAVLGYLESSKAIDDVSNEESDEIAKTVTQAILKSIPDKDKFLKDIMEKLGTGITKKLTPQIVCSNAKFAHEMLERMCNEAGEDFADLFADAVWSVLKSNIKSAIKNIAIAKLIESEIVDSTLPSDLKVADIFFKLGSGCDLCNQIVYSTVLNPLSGVTTIQFKRDGKDGFVAKDKLKVTSDVIDEDTVLSHYVICDMQRKQLIKGELEKEFQISPDNIFEIHEIALMKNGKKIGTEVQTTVEIEVPAGMLPSSVRIFRRESDGTYTDMKAYPSGNGKIMFMTTHFSEYVIVGKSNVATGITLAAPTSPIPVGGSYQLVAAAQPDGASLPDLVWASSDPSVASVDENGLVKALSVGTATISVTDTASNLSAEVEIDTVQVIDFGDGGITIKVGEKLIYTPVIQEGYVDYHYRWSSSDPSVVTVEPNEGELTGIKEGTATITMTLVDDDGNIIASSDFTVTVEKKDGFFKILFRIITAPFRAIINLFKKLLGK